MQDCFHNFILHAFQNLSLERLEEKQNFSYIGINSFEIALSVISLAMFQPKSMKTSKAVVSKNLSFDTGLG